jgi:hypothetical protein
MRLVWCLEMMVEEVWEAVEKYGIWFVRRAFCSIEVADRKNGQRKLCHPEQRSDLVLNRGDLPHEWAKSQYGHAK